MTEKTPAQASAEFSQNYRDKVGFEISPLIQEAIAMAQDEMAKEHEE